MKTYLVIAASALALAATPALANTVAAGNSSTISLSANVTGACGVGHHLSGVDVGAGDQSDIVVPLADGNGQFNAAATFNRSFGNVWCNTPAHLKVVATPLTNTTAPAYDTSSFTNRFDLQVSGGAMATYMGGATVDTSAPGTSEATAGVGGAFETGTGQYSTVNIKVLPSLRNNEPLRPVAGAYTGSVTITATVG